MKSELALDVVRAKETGVQNTSDIRHFGQIGQELRKKKVATVSESTSPDAY